jgi:3-hydroxyacyl-[acyl-carrier-protein] dehydratase
MIQAHEILQILPHRYPFVLVDRILEIEENKKAVGIKNVTINEPFFQGHFPGLPTMPGVMILEAMAQVGGVMLLQSKKGEDLVPYLAGASDFRWKKPVYPGDTMVMTVEMLRCKRNIGRVKGYAEVDGNIVAQGEISFALVPRSEVK